MACGAVINAAWDLWARTENKPLWELVVDLPPEKLLKLIDFKHLTDVITEEDALVLLLRARRQTVAASGKRPGTRRGGRPRQTRQPAAA